MWVTVEDQIMWVRRQRHSCGSDNGRIVRTGHDLRGNWQCDCASTCTHICWPPLCEDPRLRTLLDCFCYIITLQRIPINASLQHTSNGAWFSRQLLLRLSITISSRIHYNDIQLHQTKNQNSHTDTYLLLNYNFCNVILTSAFFM